MTDIYNRKENIERYQLWVYAAALLSAVSATAVIVGWVFNIPSLLSILPHSPTMKMNTAICILLVSAGVALMQKIKTTPDSSIGYKWVLGIIASVLVIIGLTTAIQYMYNIDTGIDEFFVKDNFTSINRGRMALFTACSFVLFGLSFIAFISKWSHRLAFIQTMYLPIALIASSSLISFIYGIHESSKIPFIATVAVHTAALLFILSVAGAFIHHNVGWAALVFGTGIGNTMARKVLVRIGLFALSFGFVRINYFKLISTDEDFNIILSLLIYLFISGIVVWFTANEVNKIEAKRDAAVVDANLMQLFIKEAPTAIAAFDSNIRYIAHSQNWVNDYNLHGLDIIGKSHYEIFPEIGDEWKKIHQRCLAGETIACEEDKFVRADNSVHWLKWETRPWYKTDGSIGGILMFTLDITKAKQAQEELLRANQKISSILDAATRVSIISTDTDGLITTFSKGAEAMLGYTAAEMIGKNSPAMIHVEEEVNERAAELSRIFETKISGFEAFVAFARKGSYESREWTYVDKSGRKFPVQLVVTPITAPDGSIAGFVGIASDISEQKAAEEARVKFLELEAKNRELEQFTYIASHDLQEPLKTISTFSDMLNTQYSNKLDDSGKQILTFISESAGRMTELVRGLLFYARIGSERKLEEVDFREVVDNVCKDLGSAINEKQAQINVAALPVLPAYKMEINQLFQNLISNAIKFCEKDKQPVIHIIARQIGKGWEFAVQDNGIGIAAKDRDKAFVLFKQLHNRGVYAGTGIGLAYCKKIVELHGGDMRIEEAPGGGTVFYFTINPIQYEKA